MCLQTLIFMIAGPSPVILGVEIGKAISYKMQWMPWATPHKLAVGLMSVCAAVVGMYLQCTIEPASPRACVRPLATATTATKNATRNHRAQEAIHTGTLF